MSNHPIIRLGQFDLLFTSDKRFWRFKYLSTNLITYLDIGPFRWAHYKFDRHRH